MSLDDLPDGDQDIVDKLGDYTVDELTALYGREAVRRALEYMSGLEEADQQYRQSANPQDLDEGWARGYGVEKQELDTEASDVWAERMEEEGLGIDE